MQQLNRDSIRISRKSDSDGKKRILEKGEVIGKGDKHREFYIDVQSAMEFSKYVESRTDDDPALFISERRQRMSVRAMQERLEYWCRKAEVEHINIHRLKHTYATRLANANIDSMVLKELMGHSSFTTTQQYFKLTDTTLARGYFSAMEYWKK
jgi:site-specific recombinase XerC